MEWIVFILTFLLMEGVAWFTHKYVMHGFLWILHKDHHDHSNPGWFEKNDAFFLIFATPGSLLTIIGSNTQQYFLFAIGMGITAYGIGYFLVHDVFIHQRFSWLKRTNNKYFRAIRKAHKVHHKHLGKEEGECFGMLWAPIKYFQSERKARS